MTSRQAQLSADITKAQQELSALEGQIGADAPAEFGAFINLHRMILGELLAGAGIVSVSDEDVDELNRAWHRLDPWPEAVAGLARLKSRARSPSSARERRGRAHNLTIIARAPLHAPVYPGPAGSGPGGAGYTRALTRL